jgi:hypothetical protein
MSKAYKITEPDELHYLTFQVVRWADADPVRAGLVETSPNASNLFSIGYDKQGLFKIFTFLNSLFF